MTRGTNIAQPTHSLASLGLIEYFQSDRRPTFVLEKGRFLDDTPTSSQVVFSNDALQRNNTLDHFVKTLSDQSSNFAGKDTETVKFLSWLRAGPVRESTWFHGLLWSSTYLHQRWVIVSGCYQPTSRLTEHYDEEVNPHHDNNKASERTHRRKSASADISLRHTSSLRENSSLAAIGHSPKSLAQAFGVKPSPHNLLVLGFDWAKTPLGPIQTWPQVLRQIVPYMLNGLQPGLLLWGLDRTMIYNEGYISLIKALHPGALGSSAKKVFGNFWEDKMEHEWRAVELNGAYRYENTQLYMDRSGFLEETYFTYSLTPLWDEEGLCCGVDNRCFETTRQIVVEARMLSLLKISESATSVTSLDDFWQGLVKGMASNTSDFPLFALYSLPDSDLVSNTTGVEPSTLSSRDLWILRGSTGFAPGHPTIPDALDADSDVGFAPAFKAVLSSSSPLVFSEGDSGLKADLLNGCATPDLMLRCHRIVVCPLHSSSRKVMGFLALGINPSRPYDEEYKIFVRLLSRQIETSISPILSLVNERIQAQINAQKSEYEQLLLTTQLEKQTLEARRSELRFLTFAKHAPIGVFVLGADGGVRFANEAWYKLAGVNQDFEGTHGWRLNVHPDDLQRVDDQWQHLTDGHNQTNFEWKAIKKRPDQDDEIVYLRSSCFPELSADGKMQSVTGVLMDLSLERAQQRAQDKSLKDALEAKRAQEYFMDMVSHEIRNPLHAVLQLAEETSSLLKEIRTGPTEAGDQHIRGCVENIHTIIYCGHHQKQILDDVLTLSKLNSNMLTLSLNEVGPATVVSKVLKFFDSDIRLSNIDVTLDLMGSTPERPYPEVLMDSGRVLQILFNLVGNSIKFMKDRPTRKLTVTVKIMSDKPRGGQLRYLPSGKKYADPTTGLSSGKGQAVYVFYSVEDTGPGLSIQEMNVLFERFKQVSPKTHTQYGGSGLGLFISRELAERHGGEIGLASVVNQGSTFAFYVKCLISEQERLEIDPANNILSTPRRKLTMKGKDIASPSASERRKSQDLHLFRNSTTILIVEDNVVNQKILDRQLKKLGFQTKIASHGEEALSVLKESTWWHEPTVECFNLSIVLCDLEMPVMDGLTCVRTIREWQQHKLLESDIPVVALTGNARMEQIRAAKEAGFDDVVSKPYSMQALVSLIERMTSKD